VTRSDLLRVYLRPGEEIRAEIEAGALPLVPGADPRWLTVAVRDGVVTIPGRVDQVDEHITYALDDRYPIEPTCW
jgi:hypothetical protein